MTRQNPFEPRLEAERYELHVARNRSLAWTRREFFRITGGGIVVAIVLDEALGQQQPRRGRGRGFGGGMPQEIGAWLHVGEDSAITVYTGKAEMGQNIRTSLTQVVAEELGLPPARIRLVMADTQLTPFDAGTFGSRTTPDMAAQLRRVAAAAREALFDIAAENKDVDRKRLALRDGKVIDSEAAVSFDFGQLSKGKKLMKVVGPDAPTTPAQRWKIAGTAVPKVDGRAFVTGEHHYASDVKRPGMLFGKVLRPPAFKAKLVTAQTADAEALPGVKVVHDGDFIGVVGPTQHAAERALDAIHAEWKSSRQPSSNELFKRLKDHAAPGRGGGRGRQSQGSIEEGLKSADHKLEASYTVAYIAHAPLEPRAAVAEWSDGKLTVWTGSQRPFGVRGELADALGIPAENVRVIVPDTGAGYGGKHTGEAAVEAARLSKAAGKPVKLVWTRTEEFTWAYFRPAGVIDLKAGIKKDGTLTAWECHDYNSGEAGLQTPYDVSNQRSEFHSADSPLRQGSYRALAATANHFARESHMDDLAHAAKLDPLAFRMKNLKNERLRAVLEAAAKQFDWGKPKPPAGRGFGIAAGTDKGGYVATCAEVAATAGGEVKVIRIVTAFECGAVLNPDHLKNQIEGAAVMGLGGALFEAIEFADGKILNPKFSKYRVPRFADTPRLESVLLDRKDLPSAGAGEAPIIAIAPAIGNAIFSATGIRLRSLPMVPNGLRVPAKEG